MNAAVPTLSQVFHSINFLFRTDAAVEASLDFHRMLNRKFNKRISSLNLKVPILRFYLVIKARTLISILKYEFVRKYEYIR